MRTRRSRANQVNSKQVNDMNRNNQLIPCAECGETGSVIQCKCGVPLCSREIRPECYFNHSQTMVAIEQRDNILFTNRHPLSGVNPKEFIGDSANQGAIYGQESGLCVMCGQEVTKRCRHCRSYICRPMEHSQVCMASHLKKHGVEAVFWVP